MAEQLEITAALLEKVKTYDWGQSRLALTEIEDVIKKSYGNKGEMAKIEKSLLSVLALPDTTRAGKDFICRQLSIIGTKQSVPVLAKMLTDDKYSDMARYALERIPGSSVDAALRDALPAANGRPKVGIIDSLGQRRDAKAVDALGKLLDDSDEMVAVAAAAALGRIADEKSTKIIAEAKDKTSGKVKMRIMDSYLLCAERLIADGEKPQALAIYKELQKQEMPKQIRTAAAKSMIVALK
jgi:HEAT repeat protein